MATPLKICLIEDHDDVRRELAVLLRAHGHTVSIFSDAESFKEKMPTCDVYIIDFISEYDSIHIPKGTLRRGIS